VELCYYVSADLLHLVSDQIPNAIGVDFSKPVTDQLYPYLDRIPGTEARIILPEDTPTEEAQKLTHEVITAHRRVQLTLATREQSWPLWFKNSLENYSAVVGRGIPIDTVTWPLKDKPCVIVGNGPSLAITLTKLAETRDKYSILCAWHALDKLQALNIQPDAIIHIDKQNPVGSEKNVVLSPETAIIASPITSSGFIQAFPHQPFYLLLSRESEANMRWATFLNHPAHKPAHGTVIAAALQSAQYLGHRQIILTGVDLCFPNEAQLMASYGSFRDQVRDVKNTAGQNCLTIPAFLAFKDVLENLATEETSETTFYNASPEGLKLYGYEDWVF